MATYVGRSNFEHALSSTQIFPYWRFYVGAIWLNLDNPAKPVQTSLSSEKAYELFGSAINNVAMSQVNDFRTALTYMGTGLNGPVSKTFYPYILSMTGEFDKVPKGLYSEFPVIRSNNQPRYKRAKGTGEIIVSPYQRGSVRVDFEPAVVLTSKGRTSERILKLEDILGLESASMTNPVKFGAYTFVRFPTVSTTLQETRATESLGDYNFDMRKFQDHVLAGLCSGDVATTKCVADANNGTVDLATSLAEAPKTGAAIQRGCMAILRMYKEAKNREFRLQDRVKQVRHMWDKELSRSKNLQEKDAIRHVNNAKQFEKTVNNLLHEIASVWLTYRLEVIPLASSIESSIDGLVLNKAEAKFVRFRQVEACPIPYREVDIPVRFRCFIKRSLINDAEWQSFFSVNLTKTLWELAWLSFVVDRYMAVGDWISANLSRPSAYTLFEGATKSWTIDNAIIRVPGKRITVNLRKQIVFSPDSYCSLYFPTSRTNDQRLDHLALAWAILTKKL